MPNGITQKVKERKKKILELLTDGCKTTAYIMNSLNLTHTEAFYTLKTLQKEGYISGLLVGKTAIWCLNNEHLNQLLNTMLRAIRRIVESHNLRYVYPTRLYKLVIKDPEAYRILSQYVPLYSNSGSVRAFLNYLLSLLYGSPYYRGEKIVYSVFGHVETQKPQSLT
jgi:hypothetical protein